MRKWINLIEGYTLPPETEPHDYLHGHCMVYAAALAEKYGWQPMGIYDQMWDTVPRHIGTITPDGHYADVRGHSLTEQEFLDGYDGGEDVEIRPISLEEIKRRYKRDSWDVDL